MQQFPLALLPPLDHLEDGDSSAQVSAQLQHLLIRRLVVFSVLQNGTMITQTVSQVFPFRPKPFLDTELLRLSKFLTRLG